VAEFIYLAVQTDDGKDERETDIARAECILKLSLLEGSELPRFLKDHGWHAPDPSPYLEGYLKVPAIKHQWKVP
jgi:hypothetical protein